ncbi:MAG TPA: ABC transporter substrate-binding protein [Acidimicrobiales bacterium]|nr:ABC transporter substrate-binding protein [Acidimicrobiales bacterium]
MKFGRVAAIVSGAAISMSGLSALPAPSASAQGRSGQVGSAGGPVPHGGVVHVALGGGTFPDNFNPLVPGGPNSTAAGTGSLIYEPLMYANVSRGTYTPMLATSYAWSRGNETLNVTTRSGVKWSDGTSFSAADVAFTFNYLKAHSAVDTSGLWQLGLKSVTATGPNTVVFKFSQPMPVFLPFVLDQLIIPSHIWSNVTTAITFANTHPVGTGPFLLKSFHPTEIEYTRNPDYWMPGRPYVSGVTMTTVKAGTAAALLNAGFDYIYDPIADPATSYIASNPLDNHYWWPVTNVNFLYFNTSEAPFNNVAFRKAVAEALDDNAIAARAYYGAIPATTGAGETGVIPGQQAKWVPASMKSLEWTYDPSLAAATLSVAGYRDVNGSLVSPSGSALRPLKILIGFGWADYISIAETIADELAPLGIHVVIDEEPYPTYTSLVTSAKYDMAVSWSVANSVNPFFEYLFLLDGNNTTDWERYTSTADTLALASFASHNSSAILKSDIASIERDILTNVPVVALTGRPSFFDYSTKTFTGWPDAQDPYNSGEPPDAFNGGAEQVFLNVHLQ